jgi:hypothetical protein
MYCSYSDHWSVQFSETVVVIYSYELEKGLNKPITNPKPSSVRLNHVTISIKYIKLIFFSILLSADRESACYIFFGLFYFQNVSFGSMSF